MYSEAFRRMVGAYPDVLDQMAAVDESGNTPFHLACLLGLKRLVTELFHADSEADMRLNRIGQTGQPPTTALPCARLPPGRGTRAAAAMRARTAANHRSGPPHASRRHPAHLRNRMRAGLRAANHTLWSRPRRARSTWRPLPRPWAPKRPNRPPCGIRAHCSSAQEGRGDRGEAPRHRRHAREARGRGRGAARRNPPPFLLVVTTLISINRYPYSDDRYPYSDQSVPLFRLSVPLFRLSVADGIHHHCFLSYPH